MRSFYYLTILIAVTTLATAMAHSQPLPLFTSPIEPQAMDKQRDSVLPVCYIQLQGQLRDLRRLCGKTASPQPARNMQRLNLQSSPDAEEDDTAPAAATSRRTRQAIPDRSSTPTQPLSPSASPIPSTSGTSDRPVNALPSASPSISPSSTPHPLALPADDSR